MLYRLDLPSGGGREPGRVAVTSQRFPEDGGVALTVATSSASPIIISGRADWYPGKDLVGVSGPGAEGQTTLGDGRFQITLYRTGTNRVWLAYVDATRLGGDQEAILNFSAEQEAQSNGEPAAIVIADRASPADQIVAELLESYYANLQAYREHPSDLEPGAMNAKWDTAVRIPIISWSKVPRQVNKCIYVGTFDESPRLAEMLNEKLKRRLRDSSGGFLTLMSCGNRPVLWIGGKTVAEVETAAGVYLSLMDSKYIPAFRPEANPP